MSSLSAVSSQSQWQTARVFISSTFMDMHSERDVLIKTVFPVLRERCRHHKINLFEVDLRWGITQQEAESNRSLQLCLEEIDRCRPFFVGMLGNRYGFVPSSYNSAVATAPTFDWLLKYPSGRSVTELEFAYGVFNAEPKAYENEIKA